MKTYQRILMIARPDGHVSPAMRQAAWLAHRSGAALHVLLVEHRHGIGAHDSAHETLLHEQRSQLQKAVSEFQELGIRPTVEVLWTDDPLEEINLHVVESQADMVVKDVDLQHGLRHILTTPLDRQLLRDCPVPVLLVNSDGMTPKHIVLAVDVMAEGSADALVEQAMAFAYAVDAELHLAYAFQAVPVLDPAGQMAVAAISEEIYDGIYQVHHDRFEAFADAHSVPADRRHFLVGAAAPSLFDYADRNHADVIVMGSSDRNLAERLLLGSTAEAILGRVGCDLLVVKPTEVRAHLTQRARTRHA
ncbi:universal stress protein [Solimonas marina]|uniref:Universal stress protein n=1 Tax=Solimonas marina TaxID=2714601 RepID=A0A970B5N6_9GAMM|nr:universal stress protein [Solimonas marina]NKF23587.1 universal stress protein [Solimonas marina]